MLGSKLLPLLIMGGISFHSGGAIKERLSGVVGAKEKVIAKQRMMAILESATLTTAAGGVVDVGSQAKFRTFVRRNMKIKGIQGQDSSLDPWGTPLTGQLRGGILTITSAGADKKMGTKDDVTASGSINDF